MIELLLLIGIVYWIGTSFGDHAGTIALAVVLVILVALFVGAWRDGDKAFSNFVDYWKNGGPNGGRRK